MATAITPAPTPWKAAPIMLGALAATIIQVSLLWDMSWHFSIGRDTFWMPAHIGLYVGTMVGALTATTILFHSSFTAFRTSSDPGVRVLGFHAPSGVWVTLVGAVAMLAVGFFDDWWHRNYGLDVVILSPPHVVLILGMAALQTGFWMMARVAIGNGSLSPRLGTRAAHWLAGSVVLAMMVLFAEQAFRVYMHGMRFWAVIGLVLPFLLIGFRIPGSRWSATWIALAYTVVRITMTWVLPIFPAEPRLGPIFQPVTHMLATDFPILLVIPAIAIDLVLQRTRADASPWLRSVKLGGAFLAIMLLVQWPFARFLLSDASRNPFFGSDNFRYTLRSTSYSVRGEFFTVGEPSPIVIIAVAFALAILSARGGQAWSDWAGRLRR